MGSRSQSRASTYKQANHFNRKQFKGLSSHRAMPWAHHNFNRLHFSRASSENLHYSCSLSCVIFWRRRAISNHWCFLIIKIAWTWVVLGRAHQRGHQPLPASLCGVLPRLHQSTWCVCYACESLIICLGLKPGIKSDMSCILYAGLRPRMQHLWNAAQKAVAKQIP